MESGHMAERARQRALVRRGYDAISLAYRSDDGNAAASPAEDVSRYADWVAELSGLLRPGARIVALGCGAGIPPASSTPKMTGRKLHPVSASPARIASARPGG
jgi:hypothetical protein